MVYYVFLTASNIYCIILTEIMGQKKIYPTWLSYPREEDVSRFISEWKDCFGACILSGTGHEKSGTGFEAGSGFDFSA